MVNKYKDYSKLILCQCGKCNQQITLYNKWGYKRKYAHGHNRQGIGRRGEQAANWKGGIIIKHGYRYIFKPEHPNSDKKGYVAEHAYLMSEFLGRPLIKDEHVHHKNENTLDNRIENLLLVTKQEHILIHLQKLRIGRIQKLGY